MASHGVGVLEGQDHPPGGVRARPLHLLRARPLAAQLVHDLAHPAERLHGLGRVQPGGELEDRRVGEGVVERVDLVGQAPLLADLVEQPRAHGSAQQGGVDRQRGALAAVVHVDRGPVGQPQVRLVGVALLDQRPGSQRRRGVVGLRRRQGGEALEQVVQRAIRRHGVQVAHDERAATGARPAPLPEGDDGVAGERAQVLLGTQDRAPQRVVAERGPVDQVLGHGGGLVVGPGDLLDHHAALAVELLGVQARAPHEVGEQVGRLQRGLRPHGDVERHQVVACVGVELGAQPLGGLVDVAVRRILLPALEHQVLQEMGHPVLVGALGPRAGVEPDQHRDRPRALEPDPVEGQPVLQRRRRDRGHYPSQATEGCTNACKPPANTTSLRTTR